MISATVIADSVSPVGARITTMELRYPRFIHSEFMTHRVFSRNAASSRAIPAKKIRQMVREDMVIPTYWGANEKGMQASRELSGLSKLLAKTLWRGTGYAMLGAHWALEKLGLHKQITNRILEPWSHITTLVTATEWRNFFDLRIHADAQPEIQELAKAMQTALKLHIPKALKPGDWHLPYVDRRQELQDFEIAKKVSVARCARVSYRTFEGRPSTVDEDLILYDRLVGIKPRHASPTEHQAIPLPYKFERNRNFVGWQQYRDLLGY